MESYNLRTRPPTDYKQISNIKLPRPERARKEDADKLYAVTVIEQDGDKVKIHYDGYGEEHDEWRDSGDIVHPPKRQQLQAYKPFELHRELLLQIKLSLSSRARTDPDIRIELPFDHLLFEGGLKQLGHFIRTYRGHDIYTIRKYSDLSPLLGSNWHVRGLNKRMNLYVNRQTVQFYMHKRSPLVDYTPGESNIIDTGYLLIFKFVRMDGVASEWNTIASLD